MQHMDQHLYAILDKITRNGKKTPFKKTVKFKCACHYSYVISIMICCQCSCLSFFNLLYTEHEMHRFQEITRQHIQNDRRCFLTQTRSVQHTTTNTHEIAYF